MRTPLGSPVAFSSSTASRTPASTSLGFSSRRMTTTPSHAAGRPLRPKMPVRGAAARSHPSHVAHEHGRAASEPPRRFRCRRSSGIRPDAAHHQVLLPAAQQRSAGVLVVRADGVGDGLDGELVLVQRQRVDLDLVLLDQAAEGERVADAGHLKESGRDHPVLEFPQLHVVVARAGHRCSGTVRRPAWWAAPGSPRRRPGSGASRSFSSTICRARFSSVP